MDPKQYEVVSEPKRYEIVSEPVDPSRSVAEDVSRRFEAGKIDNKIIGLYATRGYLRDAMEVAPETEEEAAQKQDILKAGMGYENYLDKPLHPADQLRAITQGAPVTDYTMMTSKSPLTEFLPPSARTGIKTAGEAVRQQQIADSIRILSKQGIVTKQQIQQKMDEVNEEISKWKQERENPYYAESKESKQSGARKFIGDVAGTIPQTLESLKYMAPGAIGGGPAVALALGGHAGMDFAIATAESTYDDVLPVLLSRGMKEDLAKALAWKIAKEMGAWEGVPETLGTFIELSTFGLGKLVGKPGLDSVKKAVRKSLMRRISASIGYGIVASGGEGVEEGITGAGQAILQNKYGLTQTTLDPIKEGFYQGAVGFFSAGPISGIATGSQLYGEGKRDKALAIAQRAQIRIGLSLNANRDGLSDVLDANEDLKNQYDFLVKKIDDANYEGEILDPMALASEALNLRDKIRALAPVSSASENAKKNVSATVDDVSAAIKALDQPRVPVATPEPTGEPSAAPEPVVSTTPTIEPTIKPQEAETAVKETPVPKREAAREGDAVIPQTISVSGKPVSVTMGKVAESAGDTLVVVDVANLDRMWSADRAEYVGKGGETTPISHVSKPRYERFSEWIKTSDKMDAPEIYVSKDGRVTFRNGRHRFAVLRDLGVTSMPVSMDEESAQRARNFGIVKEATSPTAQPMATPAPVQAAAPAAVTQLAQAPTPAPAQAADHVGFVKQTIQAEFPSIAGAVSVVTNSSQFPKDVVDFATRKSQTLDDIDAFWHGATNSVVVSANHFVNNPQKVRDKMWHEAAIHLGLRSALGEDKFNSLTLDVFDQISDDDIKALLARDKTISADDHQRIGEEHIAYNAERVMREGKNNSTWKAIAAAIRDFLRRMGLSLHYSDMDIARLARKGMKGAEKVSTERIAMQNSGGVVKPGSGPLKTIKSPVTGAEVIGTEARMSVVDYFPIWRPTAEQQLSKNKNISKSQVEQWLDNMDFMVVQARAEAITSGLVDLIPSVEEAASGLAIKTGIGPIISNADYILSFDASGICTLRIHATAYLNALSDYLEGQKIDPGLRNVERELVLTYLVKYGMPRMCSVCYVDTRRAVRAEKADDYSRFFTGEKVKGKLTEGMKSPEMIAIREKTIGKVKYNDIDQTLFLDKRRMQEAAADPNSHYSKNKELYDTIHKQSIANASSVFGLSSYSGQYRFLNEDIIRRQHYHGGLRFYSISDFMFEHSVDLMQAIADLASVGARAHIYTKNNGTVDLLKDTNIKMNLSFIPLIDRKGNIVEWTGQSFPWELGKRLREENPNIGICMLATNDRTLAWALEQPWIDYVLPYHRSGMLKAQFDAYAKAQGWHNYEMKPPSGRNRSEQKMRVVDKEKWEKFKIAYKAKFPGINYNKISYKIGWFLDGQAMSDEEIVRRALADSKRYGFALPFERWMRKADGSINPNAAKLLKDYGRTDTPQLAVVPNFDRGAFKALMDEWVKLGGSNVKINDEIVHDMAQEISFLRKKLEKNPDLEKVAWDRMVEISTRYAESPERFGEEPENRYGKVFTDENLVKPPKVKKQKAKKSPEVRLSTTETAGKNVYPSDAITINDSDQPFTDKILSGEKTIETRDKIDNALHSFIGKRVGIVRTGTGDTKVVGYATIGQPIHYTSVEQFRADESKHLVPPGSKFDIKGEKYGYPLYDVERVEPFAPTSVGRKTAKIGQPRLSTSQTTDSTNETIRNPFIELDKLKQSDFSKAGYEDTGDSSATIKVGKYDVQIYYHKDKGYFPVVRKFFGLEGDKEMSEYPTLKKVKDSIKTLLAEEILQLSTKSDTDSTGKLIHPTEEGRKNFWKWFGDSKVVDAQGRPLVMYHGTLSDIKSFSSNLPYGYAGYFTSNPREASLYASSLRGANIVPAYISIINPRIYNSEIDFINAGDARWEEAKKSGHDGIIVKEDNTHTWAIPFLSTQIKSAYGNTGQFSAENPDIRFSTEKPIVMNDLESVPDLAVTESRQISFQGFGEYENIILRPLRDRWNGRYYISVEGGFSHPTGFAMAFLDKFFKHPDVSGKIVNVNQGRNPMISLLEKAQEESTGKRVRYTEEPDIAGKKMPVLYELTFGTGRDRLRVGVYSSRKSAESAPKSVFEKGEKQIRVIPKSQRIEALEMLHQRQYILDTDISIEDRDAMLQGESEMIPSGIKFGQAIVYGAIPVKTSVSDTIGNLVNVAHDLASPLIKSGAMDFIGTSNAFGRRNESVSRIQKSERFSEETKSEQQPADGMQGRDIRFSVENRDELVDKTLDSLGMTRREVKITWLKSGKHLDATGRIIRIPASFIDNPIQLVRSLAHEARHVQMTFSGEADNLKLEEIERRARLAEDAAEKSVFGKVSDKRQDLIDYVEKEYGKEAADRIRNIRLSTEEHPILKFGLHSSPLSAEEWGKDVSQITRALIRNGFPFAIKETSETMQTGAGEKEKRELYIYFDPRSYQTPAEYTEHETQYFWFAQTANKGEPKNYTVITSSLKPGHMEGESVFDLNGNKAVNRINLYKKSKEDVRLSTEERQFPSRIIGDPAVSDAVKSQITDVLYPTIGNEETMRKANDLLSRNGIDGTMALVRDPDSDMTYTDKIGAVVAVVADLKAAIDRATADKNSGLTDYLENKLGGVLNYVGGEQLATDPARGMQARKLLYTSIGIISPRTAVWMAKRKLSLAVQAAMGEDAAAFERAAEIINDINREQIFIALDYPKLDSWLNEAASESIWDKYKTQISKQTLNRIKLLLGGGTEQVAPPLKTFADQLKKFILEKAQAEIQAGQQPALESDPYRFLIEMIANKDKNPEYYKEAWDQARKAVAAQYADSPEIMEKLDQFLSTDMTQPFTRKAFIEMVRTQMDIKDMVRRHYSEQQDSINSLADKLIYESGVSKETADKIRGEVSRIMGELTEKEKRRQLAPLLRESKAMKKAKADVDQLVELSNLGAFSKSEYLAGLARRFGLKEMTAAWAREIEKKVGEIQAEPNRGKREAMGQLLMAEIESLAFKPIWTRLRYDLGRYNALTEEEKKKVQNALVDAYRLNLFSTASFGLDAISNAFEILAQAAGGVGYDLVNLRHGKLSSPHIGGLLWAFKNRATHYNIPLDPRVEYALERSVFGEQGIIGHPTVGVFPRGEVEGVFTRRDTKLGKAVDITLGAPLYMKGAMDLYAKRLAAMTVARREAIASADRLGLSGIEREKHIEHKTYSPTDRTIELMIEEASKAGYNRPLTQIEEQISRSKTIRLFVAPFPRWFIQFGRAGAEMMGYNRPLLDQVIKGLKGERTSLTPELFTQYAVKTLAGWGAVAAAMWLASQKDDDGEDRIDWNTMEWVRDDGGRVRLRSEPISTALFLGKLLQGDFKKSSLALKYTSLPFAQWFMGQGGLISPGQAYYSFKTGNVKHMLGQLATDMINRAIPGQAMLGTLKSILDPTLREGLGANLPLVSYTKKPRISLTTGESIQPKHRLLGVEYPALSGVPLPLGETIRDPIYNLLAKYGLLIYRGVRSPIEGIPPADLTGDQVRKWQEEFGRNRYQLLGDFIAFEYDGIRSDREAVVKRIKELDSEASRKAREAVGAEIEAAGLSREEEKPGRPERAGREGRQARQARPSR